MKLHAPAATAGSKTALLLFIFLLPLATGCSIRRTAVNMVGDALASGNSVYETDDDIELVVDALPFGLKLMESLLAESPNHTGLLQTACKGFFLYSYADVDYEAQLTEETDLDKARAMKVRARKLYLRALGYGMRGLDKYYPGFKEQLYMNPEKAVARTDPKKKERDLPFLYWSAAALGSAISVSRDDAALIARLSEFEALVNRGLELDESWKQGAFHSIKIQLAGAGVGSLDEKEIRRHYDRALELDGGQDAGLYVAYAEAVSVENQDAGEFRSLMDKALSVELDKNPQNRLANSIAQRKARWLLDHIDELILE
jgi:predicted anti-sigma-YlaC factor YlaD